ncbi:hypothetical protein IL992_30250 [Microbispora sp. NEAU-D428]|uniref:hypothetical protein n=1 Tax=Microbispora sitophila TaxID=2771537 RepID=UPI0018690B43|nr:hypothetical protein [Microbispora sitophila]MBE3013430.1 hypothetical protein [Microbispora sitophila]
MGKRSVAAPSAGVAGLALVATLTVASTASGAATATTGPGRFVPGHADAAAAQSLDVPRTAFSTTSGSGDNSATWDPTLVVNVPAQAVAGTNIGTPNHSVA